MRWLGPAARVLLVVVVVAALVGVFWARTQVPPPTSPGVVFDDSDTDLSAFARAFEPRDFAFPRDHGPHLEFQTEWWYYTGNLDAADGRHFGYQLTFFRRGLAPGASDRPSDLATNQIYFAHFALTDAAANTHTEAERFSRGALGLAGASGAPYRVWLENWRAEALNADGSAVRLVAEQPGLALDLTLHTVKPIVAHGNQGLSPKSDVAGNASYYLSFTRLATTGSLTLNGEPVSVMGESWFDHEWSTSALGEGAVGWDWFSLQLSDGRELMYFQIRREDGSLEAVSGGTLVEADGTTRHLAAGDVVIDVLATWTSPANGARYPARWRVQVPSAGLDVTAEPWVADQEMRVSTTYWEGAVRLSGTSGGAAVGGNGFVELTGYAESFTGRF